MAGRRVSPTASGRPANALAQERVDELGSGKGVEQDGAGVTFEDFGLAALAESGHQRFHVLEERLHRRQVGHRPAGVEPAIRKPHAVRRLDLGGEGQDRSGVGHAEARALRVHEIEVLRTGDKLHAGLEYLGEAQESGGKLAQADTPGGFIELKARRRARLTDRRGGGEIGGTIDDVFVPEIGAFAGEGLDGVLVVAVGGEPEGVAQGAVIIGQGERRLLDGIAEAKPAVGEVGVVQLEGPDAHLGAEFALAGAVAAEERAVGRGEGVGQAVFHAVLDKVRPVEPGHLEGPSPVKFIGEGLE
ncbi:MAG: hypothetical protein M5U12_14695 [Verrucomicrobia bacterium]|nr:hypothetical protein [Verrucomicrobiota bacterium]